MEISEINGIIEKMTLEEKAALCEGRDGWSTVPFEKLGIPSIVVSDGPHGLRKKADDAVQLGLESCVVSTCFPTSATTASSWDRELLCDIGAAIGEEAQSENVQIVLGPGANIKRTPLNGRNFEYYSEDPFLSSQMAKSFIGGVQSKGVGTSLKHFFANNQETNRMTINALIDDRTMREIYLASFEAAVKEAKPTTMMCSYNKVNGVFSSENEFLLTKVLRDEWGFDGFVMSDWGAVNDREKGLAAGLELEMPSSCGVGTKKIIDAVRRGDVSEETLDNAVRRLLKVIFELYENKYKDYACDMEAHDLLAERALCESAVLLKNDGGLLPLRKSGKIAVIGDMAETPRIQGAGSSHVTVAHTSGILEAMRAAAPDAQISYSAGYIRQSDKPDAALIKEAVEAAKAADCAVIVAGLPEDFESEGFDRLHMHIPASHIALIEEVGRVQPNTVVVLINGSPIELLFAEKIPAIMEIYLGGQAVGRGFAKLLFGDVSPSGRLAETFPVYYENCPSYTDTAFMSRSECTGKGGRSTVNYGEGLLVGYRYFTTRRIPVRYPFGFGLSYSSFEYSDLRLSSDSIKDTDTLSVSVNVKNTGSCAAKEVVELYVSAPDSKVFRPVRELREFAKIELLPGETKTVGFELSKRAFAYYDTDCADWRAESGKYIISVCKDCETMLLSKSVTVEDTLPAPVPKKHVFSKNSTLGDLKDDELGKEIFDLIIKCSNGSGMVSEAIKNENMMDSVYQFALRQVFYMWLNMPDEKLVDFLTSSLNSGSGRQSLRKALCDGTLEKMIKNII